MDDLELKDYQKWKEVNRDCFSLFDYFRGSLLSGESSPDIIVAFVRLIFPELVESNGMVFLQELFSPSKFNQLSLQGLETGEIEYWMNLLPVSDILVSFPESFVADLIPKIKSNWEKQLATSYQDRKFEVLIIDDEGDLFLSFKQKVSLS